MVKCTFCKSLNLAIIAPVAREADSTKLLISKDRGYAVPSTQLSECERYMYSVKHANPSLF